MMRGLIGRRQVAEVTNLDSSTVIANNHIHRLFWSAITLAFFVALITGAMIARRDVHRSNIHTQATVESTEINDDLKVPAPLVDEQDGSTASPPDNTTTTIDSKATVNNGKADVSVTVNGQSIPVAQNGSTHTDVDDNHTSVDVNINNGQTTTNSSDSSNVNVMSQSFQSTFTFGNNP